MSKGRKKKPTATKKLAGNPGYRKLNELEPTPELILPPAPADLTDVGKAKWNEVALLLFNQGILTEMDTQALYFFCVDFQVYDKLSKRMMASGEEVVNTSNGNPIQSPYLSIINQCRERMNKALIEFGMTPASRSKVSMVPRAKPQSLAEKFFNAPVAKSVKDKK